MPDTLSRHFQERMIACASAVETQLGHILEDEGLSGETLRPPRLLAAMRHAALSGGKRLRPFLMIETARMLGREDHGVLLAGCGLELVHCYSLVHDDLPSMDDDDLRRGRPTVHKAYDEATAILAGDALLTLAFDVTARADVDPDPQMRLDLVIGLARAAGVGGMVGGQMLDLAAEGRFEGGVAHIVEAAAVKQLQAMKTGALIAFAVRAGARLGRADAAAEDALARFGDAVGAAFQIADDVMDSVADAGVVGKATGKDAARGKATLVAALGLAGARAHLAAAISDALDALSGFGPEADMLREAARFTASRRT